MHRFFTVVLSVLLVSACGAGRPVSQDGEAACPGAKVRCGGACVDLNTDLANCGGCGVLCDTAKGFTCASGTCACVGGKTSCSGTCVDTSTDRENCGACGSYCAIGEKCAGGKCTNPCAHQCSGVCVDLSSSDNHCGKCNNPCNTTKGFLCVSGKCVCGGGYTNCGGTCVDTKTDPNNCGACGCSCAGASCKNGGCYVSCPKGQKACGTGTKAPNCPKSLSTCVDLSTDPKNCGNCGIKCTAADGFICVAGQCDCPVGKTDCFGVCVDTKTDPNNCGICGGTCGWWGVLCANGNCI